MNATSKLLCTTQKERKLKYTPSYATNVRDIINRTRRQLGIPQPKDKLRWPN